MTEDQVDPFHAVQSEVADTLSNIEVELIRWRKLPGKSPKSEPLRQKLLSSLSELHIDLRDMQATIDIALRDPSKFALTPSELMTRQEFVRELQAQANDARESLWNSVAAGTPPKISSQQEVLADTACKVCSAAARSAWQYATWESNEGSCSIAAQQRKKLYWQQEVELGVLDTSISHLGEMSKTMNEDLRKQGQELEGVAEEIDEISFKLSAATAVMKKMLKNKDRGKFCAIIVLTLALVVLLYAVIAW